MWRGGVGGTYLLPALSSAGASLAPPCCRFHTPLIEPDVRICRIRLSDQGLAFATRRSVRLISSRVRSPKACAR